MQRIARNGHVSGRMLRRLVLCPLMAMLPIHAQWTQSMGQRGFVPGASYDGDSIENVSAVNGNLMLQIPITTLPHASGGLDFNLSLIYNSGFWNTAASQWLLYTSPPPTAQNMYAPQNTLQPVAPWSYSYNYQLVLEEKGTPSVLCSEDTDPVYDPTNPPLISPYYLLYVDPHAAQFQFRLRAVFPDGSQHVLYLMNAAPGGSTGFFSLTGLEDDSYDSGGWFAYGPDGKASQCVSVATGYPGPLTGTLVYATRDGTHLRVTVPADGVTPWTSQTWTMHFTDGRVITGQADQTKSICDRNSNCLNITPSSVTCQNLPGVTNACGPTDDPTQPEPLFTLSSGSGTSVRTISIWQGTDEDYITQAGVNDAVLVWKIDKTILSSFSVNYYCNQVVSGSLNNLGTCTWSAPLGMYSAIHLPTKPGYSSPLEYTFEYNTQSTQINGQGSLTEVKYPYGATVDYTYTGNRNYSATDNPISSKTRTSADPSSTTNGQLQEVWSYTLNAATAEYATVRAPDGGVTSYWSYPRDYGNAFAGRTYKVQYPDGSLFEQAWGESLMAASPVDVICTTEVHSVAQNGQATLAAAKTHTYDVNGNPRFTTEYDWIPYSSVQHVSGGMGQLTDFASTSGMPLLQQTQNQYSTGVPDSVPSSPQLISAVTSPNAYWQQYAARLLDAPSQTTVSDSSGSNTAQATYTYDNPLGTGNLTTEADWDSLHGKYLNTIRTYDPYGELASVTKPLGNKVSYTYDGWSCLTNETWPITFTWIYTCDQMTGLRTKETDPNPTPFVTIYGYDPLGRQTSVQEGNVRETNSAFSDVLPTPTATKTTDVHTYSLGGNQVTQSMDQLGRVYQTSATGNDGVAILTNSYEQTQAGVATYKLVSNPYRTTSDATMGWTRTKLDTNGRVVEVATFSGSTLPAPWGSNTSSAGATTTSYSGNTATTTDPAGAVRTVTTDGLGRVRRVDESTAGSTAVYTYDCLDDLHQVQQGPSTSGTPTVVQTRTFVYDLLKRLTSASNPESGTTTYNYDDNSNLYTRTDANGVITTYGYDTIDRIKTKSYNPANTNGVTYTYDTDEPVTGATGVNYPALRLSEVVSGGAATVYRYDGLGRATAEAQTQDTVSYPFLYGYEPAGLVSMQYPSGRVVGITNGQAGLPQQVGQGATTYGVATYAQQGAIQTLQLGVVTGQQPNGVLTETWGYNGRMQPTSMVATPASGSPLLQLGWTYGTTNNNGNLQTQTITAPRGDGQGQLTLTQSYGYDGVNRLTGVQENVTAGLLSGETAGSWNWNFGRDNYGNIWSSSNPPGWAPVMAQAQNYIDATTNKLLMSGALPGAAMPGDAYDSAGHLVDDPVIGQVQYDGEGRAVQVTNGANVAQYTYDGEGRRVKKVETGANAGTTVYVYDAGGNLAAEYGGTPDTGRRYLTVDHLGSTRLVTNDSGGVVQREDYFPYGQEIPASAAYANRNLVAGYGVTTPVTLKFTGKERDAETGLDYFGARYMSSPQGRFTSPDPIHFQAEMLTDPQRFNLYAYGRNNPLAFVDPSGEVVELSSDANERNQQVAALCSGAHLSAEQCSNYVSVDSTTKKGHYYLAIANSGQSGEDADFGSLNSVAASLQAAVQDPHLARLHIIAGNEDFETGPRTISHLDSNGEGATVTFRGVTDIYVLDPNYHDRIHDTTGYSDLSYWQRGLTHPFGTVHRTIDTVMYHLNYAHGEHSDRRPRSVDVPQC